MKRGLLQPLHLSPVFRCFSSRRKQIISQIDAKGRIHYQFTWEKLPDEKQQSRLVQIKPAGDESPSFFDRATLLPKHLTLSTESIIKPFLPHGVPNSVGENYLEYTKWHMLAATASSVNGVLSMQALLYAVGLGAGAIPMAAALNWVIKDGLGQVGGVAFASLINNKFDADPKRWRGVSAVALDVATFIEILTPCFPKLFLFLASMANIGKNISWLSASATRAGIHQSFAKNENLGDITAKAGSQSILASILGTAIGVTISPYIGSETTALVGCFGVLSTVHLGCLYKSLSYVALPTLNRQRLRLILNSYNGAEVPSMVNVSHQEMALFGDAINSDIVLNTSLDNLLSKSNANEVFGILANENYLLNFVDGRQSGSARVALLFHKKASSLDVLYGYFHAVALLNSSSKHSDSVSALRDSYSPEQAREFVDKLDCTGWHTAHHFIESNKCLRYTISDEK